MTEDIRVVFCSDIHGSTACFRKALDAFESAARPQVVVIGGDITGKALLLIVRQGRNRFELTDEEGLRVPIRSDQLACVQESLADKGLYSYICDEDEARRIRMSRKKSNAHLLSLQKERLADWLKLAEERLAGSSRLLIINCGNDDPLSIDGTIDSCHYVVRAEGRVIRLGEEISIISMGYSTPTPWNTPREKTERELEDLISVYADAVPDLSRCIFNFHCPPRDTLLDLAPKLDPVTLRPVVSALGLEWEHVGSGAVLRAIEHLRPLCGLHGHVHEQHASQFIGRTWCCNPGSMYQKGLLQSALISFRDAELVWHELKRDTVPLAQETWLGLLGSVVHDMPGGNLLARLIGGITNQADSSLVKRETVEELASIVSTIAARVESLATRHDTGSEPVDDEEANSPGAVEKQL